MARSDHALAPRRMGGNQIMKRCVPMLLFAIGIGVLTRIVWVLIQAVRAYKKVREAWRLESRYDD